MVLHLLKTQPLHEVVHFNSIVGTDKPKCIPRLVLEVFFLQQKELYFRHSTEVDHIKKKRHMPRTTDTAHTGGMVVLERRHTCTPQCILVAW